MLNKEAARVVRFADLDEQLGKPELILAGWGHGHGHGGGSGNTTVNGGIHNSGNANGGTINIGH
ncbi:hypothetical protein [Sorangium sp. So ce363]|uniref:hypothetical protein n=1 Tax=Sorangium sp. So ce363 TaxID=3133304 RepID=UPI003F635DB7